MLAEFQAFDTDLVVFGVDALRRRAIEGDERGVVDAALHQLLGELHAGARRGIVVVERIACHAEALAGQKIVIGRLDGRGADEIEARLVGIERRAIVLRVLQRLGKNGQRVGAAGLSAGQLIAVERRIGRLGRNRGIVRDRIGGTRHFDPQIAVVRVERKRALEGVEGIIDIARGELDAAKSDQALDALPLQFVAERQRALGIARTLDEIVGEEGEGRGSADIRFAGGSRLDDLAGDRAGEAVELVEVRLHEAPLHLGIVGEGFAGLVGDAGGGALIQRHVLLGAQIEAEVVAVLGGHHLALDIRGQRRAQRCESGEKKSREADKRALRHKSSPRCPFLMAAIFKFRTRLSTERRAAA